VGRLAVNRAMRHSPMEDAAVRSLADPLDDAAPQKTPFPPMRPSLRDRWSALHGRLGALPWLYVLVPVPLVTDWIENGALPTTPRGWLTEVAGGIVIGALVTRVRRDRRALETLARCDSLTGLPNRRAFELTLEAECARARRSGAPLSIVYLDIDRFKEINDRFGHAAGDQVLRQLAAAIGETLRTGGDSGFRLGGDEFALLLSASTRLHAETVVARIRSFCATHDANWVVGAFEFSAGIVELDPRESAQSLLNRSDAAMYRQKASRRSPVA
jgi:diguanylate cyclase (GGDEF)-like protein